MRYIFVSCIFSNIFSITDLVQSSILPIFKMLYLKHYYLKGIIKKKNSEEKLIRSCDKNIFVPV